jgi:hypothetical protein
MDHKAIQRVTRAIASRIEANLTPIPTYDGVLIGPPNAANATRSQIVLYPYRLVANASLRNAERVLPPTELGGAPKVYDESLPLDASYLITIGDVSSETPDAQMPLQEVLWESLGRAIQALQGAPFLAGEPVAQENVRLSLEPVTAEEMSRIWSLFPNADYRTSVVYLASPIWLDTRESAPAGPVVDHRHLAGQRIA